MSIEKEPQNLPVGKEVTLQKHFSTIDKEGQMFSCYFSSSKENNSFKYEELDNEIINFVIYEKSNKEIAQITGYSLGMIKFRLNALFKQYGVKTKAGLVREIFQKNIFLPFFKD